MIVLSNGYQQPETGDRGPSFFPALEQNIQRVNDHTHNGVDSERISIESIGSLSATINPTDWTGTDNGMFRALLALPGSLQFDETNLSLRTNNRILYADIERVTTNNFYVYVSDSALTVEVLYK